jgi:hypothetical protein
VSPPCTGRYPRPRLGDGPAPKVASQNGRDFNSTWARRSAVRMSFPPENQRSSPVGVYSKTPVRFPGFFFRRSFGRRVVALRCVMASQLHGRDLEALLQEIQAGLTKNEQLRLRLKIQTAEGRQRMRRATEALARWRAKLDASSGGNAEQA